MRIVDGAHLTETPSLKICVRFAVPLFNHVVKPSYFYDIMCNPNYVTGRPFPFLETFCWFDQHTKKLDTILTTDVEMVSVSRQIDSPKVEEDVTSRYPSSSWNSCHRGIEKNNNRKIPVGQKAVKAAKKNNPEDSMVEDHIEEALDNWTTSFSEANDAPLKAVREAVKEKAKIEQKELELKEKASEFHAFKLFFTGNG